MQEYPYILIYKYNFIHIDFSPLVNIMITKYIFNEKGNLTDLTC